MLGQFETVRHGLHCPCGLDRAVDAFLTTVKTPDDQPQAKALLDLMLELLGQLALLLHIPHSLFHTGRTQEHQFIKAGHGDKRLTLSDLQLCQQASQYLRLRFIQLKQPDNAWLLQIQL
ncbi:hypothetical protein D3C78_1652140 [compost metagenome]